MRYQAKINDSPTRIAREYGVAFDALIAANPHKPTTVVAGRRTWASLAPNETIIVPVGGMVADAITDAINAMGSPCDPANVAAVCVLQRLLGVTVDGKYGSGTAAAARARFPGAPAGCSPRPSWWAPAGQSNCTAAAPTASAPPAAGSSLDRAAGAALAALLADPGYCTSVKRSGSPVNTAIHNFKSAWNAANPTNPVPINTGNYEPIVQIALALALNTAQSNVPPGCGAVPTAPAPTPQQAPPIQASTAPAVTSSFVDPCDPANVASVCAAQRALGVTVDGKYGPGTAAAAQRTDPNAPGPCSPRPSWWRPAGQSNCPGGAAAPMPTPATPTVTPVSVPAAVAALATVDPCSQSSLDVVYAAQRALGVSPDGKYGTDTASAARRVLPNAPAACSPRPAWWAPPGTSNLPGGDTMATPPPRPPQPGPPIVVQVPTCPAGSYYDSTKGACLPNASQAQPPGGQPIVVAPAADDKKKVSTGAIVAGALGAAALVGLIAVAATSKTGHRGARGPRGPAHRKHKSSHRRKR